jgi:hypothetical protein
MIGDMVSLCKGFATVLPLAGKTYVAVTPFADVGVADVTVELPCTTEGRATIFPLALISDGVGLSDTQGRVG